VRREEKGEGTDQTTGGIEYLKGRVSRKEGGEVDGCS
jgi:hypothetical protein